MAKEKEFTIVDTYFKFPIRIYDEMNSRRIIKKEDDNSDRDVFEALPNPYVIGFARLPYSVAKDIQWSDGHTRTRSLADVDDKGFDYTNVVTKDMDVFICAYKRDKFEKFYFDYISKADAFFNKTATSADISAPDVADSSSIEGTKEEVRDEQQD